MNLSIIIVNYKLRIQIIECINSILKNSVNTSFEVIVVDNEGDSTLKKDLSVYANIRYIESRNNLGFGGGNNLGASYARGKYILFLNPDTIVTKNSIQILFEFINKRKSVGAAAPLLLDTSLKPFSTQSRKELTPVNALFSFSFLRKLFPNKSIYHDTFFKKWSFINPIETDTVPGAAFVISKDLFSKVGGFDERFFLYFEENDLSKRIKELGFKLFIVPKSKIIHKVGQSTKQVLKNDEIFKKSRYLYFKKHYGLLTSLLLETFLRINKSTILISLILLIALFLRTINLSISMPFIGDQGWFYMSARDLLINQNFPLVGITSSHTWLHQGPLWTYILSVALLIGKYNPISGGLITALFGIFSTYLMWRLGKSIFSEKVGVVAAFLYAVSPLIVFFERMPFDPSIIPFFTICYFYSVYKWVEGEKKYFPFIFFLFAILYNLELATFTLIIPTLLLLAFGVIKKKKYFISILNKDTLFKSVILFLLPMIPVIIYDLSNGFKQTIVFLIWVIYKPFSFLINPSAVGSSNTYLDVLMFLYSSLSKLVLNINPEISFIIFILSIVIVLYKLKLNTKASYNKYLLLLIFLTISVVGILINKTSSDAYLPIIFPFIIFTLSIFITFLLEIKKFKFNTFLLLILILLSNFVSSYTNTLKPDYQNRIKAVEKIIVLTKGQEYNLVGEGNGSQFESFTMNYEYLLWWKGHQPSKDKKSIKIYISEDEKGIHIR